MEQWYSFLYLYGVGGIIFGFGIFLGLKNGVLILKRKTDRVLLSYIIGAYFFYFIIHGLWNIWAIAWR